MSCKTCKNDRETKDFSKKSKIREWTNNYISFKTRRL